MGQRPSQQQQMLSGNDLLETYGIGIDTPLFPGAWLYSEISAGGSIACAAELNKGTSDICINWSGGMHHALVKKASGFCFVNDVVLANRELLKYHKRVLYVDIDVHHGDGVEKAFASTNRVMTCSFHKFGVTKNGKSYFPHTGRHSEVGTGVGKFFAVNVPLHSGIDDETFVPMFKAVIREAMQCFAPEAIVMQCGADSLGGDPVGVFNLTTRGHGECVRFIKDLSLPTILLGGGGYSKTNVSRLWTYETAIALGIELPEEIPFHSYWQDYARENYKLHTTKVAEIENENTSEYLEEVLKAVTGNLRNIQGPPSVHIQDTN